MLNIDVRGREAMLRHGILGLLNYGEMTGYEIRETFQNSLNFFWPAQTSQIYRELAALEEKGWIEKHTVAQSGKPDKNICSITAQGRCELLRWLAEPAHSAAARSPILMKTFFMGELSDNEGLAFFKQLREQQRDYMQTLEQTDGFISQYRAQVPDGKSALFWQMTADFGDRYGQMYLQWLDACIRLLETEEEKT